MSSGAVQREPSGASQRAGSPQQYYPHGLDATHACTQKEVSELGKEVGEVGGWRRTKGVRLAGSQRGYEGVEEPVPGR